MHVNAKRPAYFAAWSGLHFFSLVMHLNSVAHLCALFASTAADTDIAATSSATRAPNTARSHALSSFLSGSVGKPSRLHMAVRQEPPVTMQPSGSQPKKSSTYLHVGAKKTLTMMTLRRLPIRCHA